MPNGYQLGRGTVVRFQGADRCKVFNNLCTQDLRNLVDGQALETFVTNVKGHTFGHGIAMSLDGEAYFITVPDQGAKLVPHFDRYIIREDAVLKDMSDEFQFWLFTDRSSAARAFSLALDQIPERSNAVRLELAGQSFMLLHAPWIGSDSILALASSTASDEKVHIQLGADWVRSDLVERQAWELARIQSFWPWYGIDFDERHLPQEIDRDKSAISFNKGCYLGQETIARLDMLGKIQKKLLRLAIQTNVPPKANTPIYADEKEVGFLGSAAYEPASECCLCMAFVKRSHFAAGQILSVDGHKATVQ